MSLLDDGQYHQWKTTLVPLIYDWFSNHNLDWPSQTCRWGPKLEEATYKCKYRVYLSEQTDGSEPQKLKIVTADVCKPRVAASEAVSHWKDLAQCPYIKDYKTIYHPGEVNKIRELPQHQNIIVTHTDSPQLYVWNVEKQPARQKGDKKKSAVSVADLVLTGHEEDAQFPLSTCSNAPCVASGGTDKLVLLWDLQDSTETVLAGAGGSAGAKEAPTLEARTRLKGHTDTVEDVVFKYNDHQSLVSVGDDHQILFWDTRAGLEAVKKVENAHGKHDIHCVDWSPLVDHLIATGAADGSLKVWDDRMIQGARGQLNNFKVHRDAIMRIEWHPTQPYVLASGGDDRRVLIWELTQRVAKNSAASDVGPNVKRQKTSADSPPELLFQHVGHRAGKVVDFQWNPTMPWTMISVSDNTADEEGGGGTLQMWRVQDLIYRPDEEVLHELDQHREFILYGTNPPTKPKPKTPVSEPKKSAADTSTPPAATAQPATDDTAVAADLEGEAQGEAEAEPAEAEAATTAAEPAADAAADAVMADDDAGAQPAAAAAADEGTAGEEEEMEEEPAEAAAAGEGEAAVPAEAAAAAEAMQVDNKVQEESTDVDATVVDAAAAE